MKSVAIMQPYFLPYLGYFQLLAAVDTFVVLDDVNYINQGWVNRNRLLLNGAPHTFTVPLRSASQNKLICDIELVSENNWRHKLTRTIQQSYRRAPCYSQVYPLLLEVVNYPAIRLADFLLHSISQIIKYLALEVEMVSTSRVYKNENLRGQDRILDICNREQADLYLNPIGGLNLYDRATFLEQGIQIKFLRSLPVNYQQGKGDYVPWLSIIDVLMYNELPEVRKMLVQTELV